jgi:hypothetical protein
VTQPPQSQEPQPQEEVDRLRAERDDLRVKLESKEEKRRRGGRVRRTFVVLLVVLASLLVPLATTAVWARRTVVNTNEFEDTVGPLARDRAVQIALTNRLTSQIMTAVNVKELFAQALPERGQFLAGPLTNAIEGFVHEKVATIVSSEQFARLWEEATRRAQIGMLAVLRDKSETVRTENGRVVLNLVPVINAVLASINKTSPEVLGHDVTLPQINSAELPDAARKRLERALGHPLPQDFGRIVVFRANQLSAVQDTFHLVERSILLLVIVSLACVAGALALSKSRRRTLLQLVFGIAFGLVLVRRLSLRSQADLLELFKVQANRAAAAAASDRVLSGLLDITRWMLIGLVVVAVVALLTGPYHWAVALRRGVVSLGRGTAGAAGRVRDEATLEWVVTHRQALQVAGLVFGFLMLLLFNLSWFGFLLVLGLVVALELWLARLGKELTASG